MKLSGESTLLLGCWIRRGLFGLKFRVLTIWKKLPLFVPLEALGFLDSFNSVVGRLVRLPIPRITLRFSRVLDISGG